MSFLPNNYVVPKGSNNYMRWQDGENLIRILSNPVLGWEFWTDETDEEGKQVRKPHRVHDYESVPVTIVDEEGRGVKHFWAMIVWDYQDKKVKILEITQKGIQRAIQALEKSKGWGDPKNFDISVTKTGQKMETEYSVMPVPPKPLASEIRAAFNKTSIELEALYRGDDPFKSNKESVEPEEVNV